MCVCGMPAPLHRPGEDEGVLLGHSPLLLNWGHFFSPRLVGHQALVTLSSLAPLYPTPVLGSYAWLSISVLWI